MQNILDFITRVCCYLIGLLHTMDEIEIKKIKEAPGRYRLQKVKTLGRQGSDMVVQGLPDTSAGAAPLRIVTRGTAALKALLKP